MFDTTTMYFLPCEIHDEPHWILLAGKDSKPLAVMSDYNARQLASQIMGLNYIIGPKEIEAVRAMQEVSHCHS